MLKEEVFAVNSSNGKHGSSDPRASVAESGLASYLAPETIHVSWQSWDPFHSEYLNKPKPSPTRNGLHSHPQLSPELPLGRPMHQEYTQEYTKTPTMTISPQRRTAESLVAAFNNMDVDGIIAHRSPDCLRHFIPTSMGFSPQDNDTYGKSLHQLSAIFHNFSCTINDLLEDKQANRICLYLSARGDSMAGEYVNEYMWLLDFDPSGEKITRSKEYSDTALARDFFPKLKAAMTERSEHLESQDRTMRE